jgi:hypothetical protein
LRGRSRQRRSWCRVQFVVVLAELHMNTFVRLPGVLRLWVAFPLHEVHRPSRLLAFGLDGLVFTQVLHNVHRKSRLGVVALRITLCAIALVAITLFGIPVVAVSISLGAISPCLLHDGFVPLFALRHCLHVGRAGVTGVVAC